MGGFNEILNALRVCSCSNPPKDVPFGTTETQRPRHEPHCTAGAFFDVSTLELKKLNSAADDKPPTQNLRSPKMVIYDMALWISKMTRKNTCINCDFLRRSFEDLVKKTLMLGVGKVHLFFDNEALANVLGTEELPEDAPVLTAEDITARARALEGVPKGRPYDPAKDERVYDFCMRETNLFVPGTGSKHARSGSHPLVSARVEVTPEGMQRLDCFTLEGDPVRLEVDLKTFVPGFGFAAQGLVSHFWKSATRRKQIQAYLFARLRLAEVQDIFPAEAFADCEKPTVYVDHAHFEVSDRAFRFARSHVRASVNMPSYVEGVLEHKSVFDITAHHESERRIFLMALNLMLCNRSSLVISNNSNLLVVALANADHMHGVIENTPYPEDDVIPELSASSLSRSKEPLRASIFVQTGVADQTRGAVYDMRDIVKAIVSRSVAGVAPSYLPQLSKEQLKKMSPEAKAMRVLTSVVNEQSHENPHAPESMIQTYTSFAHHLAFLSILANNPFEADATSGRPHSCTFPKLVALWMANRRWLEGALELRQKSPGVPEATPFVHLDTDRWARLLSTLQGLHSIDANLRNRYIRECVADAPFNSHLKMKDKTAMPRSLSSPVFWDFHGRLFRYEKTHEGSLKAGARCRSEGELKAYVRRCYWTFCMFGPYAFRPALSLPRSHRIKGMSLFGWDARGGTDINLCPDKVLAEACPNIGATVLGKRRALGSESSSSKSRKKNHS